MELIENVVVCVCMIAYIMILIAVIYKPRLFVLYLKRVGMQFHVVMILFLVWIALLLLMYWWR